MARFSFRRTAVRTSAAVTAGHRPVRVRARLVTTSAGTIWVRPEAGHTRVQPAAQLAGVAMR
jgi:hypothetical protein